MYMLVIMLLWTDPAIVHSVPMKDLESCESAKSVVWESLVDYQDSVSVICLPDALGDPIDVRKNLA